MSVVRHVAVAMTRSFRKVVVEVMVWVVMICGHVSQRDLSQGEVPRFCG